MPPRLPHLRAASRALALRTRTRPLRPANVGEALPIQTILTIHARRGYADKKNADVGGVEGGRGAIGPNQDVLGNVNEEAAEVGRTMGETEPALDQATPVQEVLERDEQGKEMAPDVIKEQMDNPSPDSTKSSTTTNTQSLSSPSSPGSLEGIEVEADGLPSLENIIAIADMEAIAIARSRLDRPGNKFDLPSLPLSSQAHMKYRYDPIVKQVTNLMMKHGKLGVAQRNMSHILNHLRTAPPPVPSPTRPLVPGSPPASHLPLDPTLYLTTAIDSVAPLLRIRSQKGAAGGGVALQIPVPLGLRQRRRTAVQWILDAASKKRSRGSGKMMFAQKVAEEIVGVVEGRSSAWEKRQGVHRIGTGARTNLTVGMRRKF